MTEQTPESGGGGRGSKSGNGDKGATSVKASRVRTVWPHNEWKVGENTLTSNKWTEVSAEDLKLLRVLAKKQDVGLVVEGPQEEGEGQ